MTRSKGWPCPLCVCLPTQQSLSSPSSPSFLPLSLPPPLLASLQSVQFRLVENKLGLPQSARLAYGHRGYCTYLAGKDAGKVQESEKEPSLHDLVEAWLERTPFLAIGTFNWWKHYEGAVKHMLDEDERAIRANSHMIAAEMLAAQLKELEAQREHYAALFNEDKYKVLQEKGERRLSYRAMQAALLITLYQTEPILHLPYKLISTLVDIDENFTLWRYRHALMVHRQLGLKMGTGGSSGYHYLRATAERHKIFQDLTNMATFLIPRALLPPLPEDVKAKLTFSFNNLAAPSSGAKVPALAAPAAAAAGSGSAASSASASSMLEVARAAHSGSVPTALPADMAEAAAAAGCPFAARMAASKAAEGK